MTLKELLLKVRLLNVKPEMTSEDGTDNKRVTRKGLLEGNIPIIAEAHTYMGNIYVFADGTVLFEDDRRHTIFPVSECVSFTYTSMEYGSGITCKDVPYANVDYALDLIMEMGWAIGVSFVGMYHIDVNRNKKKKAVSLEAMTFGGSSDADEEIRMKEKIREIRNATPDFSRDADRRVDVERVTAILTPDQSWVIRSRYEDDKTFQTIGEDRGSEKAKARSSAKNIHDRGMNAIRRIAGSSLDNYRDE